MHSLEVITYICMKMHGKHSIKVFTAIHAPFFQFWSDLSWHSLCTHLWHWSTSCIIWWAEPWLIPSSDAKSSVITWQFSRVTPSPCFTLSGSVMPTWAISISYTWHPILELPLPLYTCCSEKQVAPWCVFMLVCISFGFTPPLLKKRFTERCSSLVQVSSRAAIFELPRWRKTPNPANFPICRSLVQRHN